MQHDAARADAHGLGVARDVADHHRRRGAGDAGHVVMLGQPVAVEACAFGGLGKFDGGFEGVRRCLAFRHGRLVVVGKVLLGGLR
jgi:hypothetical protein